jgi:hypothetical protein
MLVVQTEASYHAAYDHCTVACLQQARVAAVRFLRLAGAGLRGNGHMLMLEKNSLEIAAVVDKWSLESVDKSRNWLASRSLTAFAAKSRRTN